MNDILEGYCQCGCGQKTSITTVPGGGYKKGQPKKFIRFHNSTASKKPVTPKKCAICGTEIIPRKKSRQERTVTCSVKCRNIYSSRQSKEKRADTLRDRGRHRTYRKRAGRHEHRIVMEEVLGRPLECNEIVHHLDSDRYNNSPENLVVVSRSEHAKIHFTKKRGVGGDVLREPKESYQNCTY